MIALWGLLAGMVNVGLFSLLFCVSVGGSYRHLTRADWREGGSYLVVGILSIMGGVLWADYCDSVGWSLLRFGLFAGAIVLALGCCMAFAGWTLEETETEGV